MQKETLTFLRVARKATDSYDGYLYLHHFGTGYQLLVFPTHEAADKMRAKFGTPEYAEYLKTPA
jgi:hypothetical protein